MFSTYRCYHCGMGVTKMRCVKAFLIAVTSVIVLLLLLSNNSGSIGDLHCDKHVLNCPSLASEDNILDEQFVEDSSDRRDHKTSVSLSLHYMDQITWGARRLRSLQCWAAQLDRTMRVVEPSMNNTYFGAPVITPVDEIKFRNIFDIEVWNQYGEQEGYDSLVSWNEFRMEAPRETVLVQIIYKTDKMCVDPSSQRANCTLHEVKKYWSDTLKQFSFTVIREVCIDFRDVDILPTKEFNEYIFGSISRDTPVTVIFNE